MADTPEMITPAVSDRICKHMNKDHADAVLLYAQYFGSVLEAETATLIQIDDTGMDLTVTIASSVSASEPREQSVRVPFARPLADAKDAHVVLVEMMKEAQGLTMA